MSVHDRIAETALDDGNTPHQFRAAAKSHAKAFWLFAAIGAGVWFFAGWGWSLMPLGLALLVAVQSISSTLTAKRLERLIPHAATAPGATPQPAYSADPTIEAAYRILVRGSQNPGGYTHDPRYVLWFACSHVASLAALKGDLNGVAAVVGESSDTIGALLQSAGYDLPALLTGDKQQRFVDAMAATDRLFPDIEAKYGDQVPKAN